MSGEGELDKILERKYRELINRMFRGGGERVKSEEIVYNVSDSDFNEKVIKRSMSKPVVVDFWAPWCAPCMMLAPVLERVVRRFGGRVLLAKLNVDENPYTASKYGVMSIPTVMLFVGGRVADYFIGFMPEEAIVRWLTRNLGG